MFLAIDREGNGSPGEVRFGEKLAVEEQLPLLQSYHIVRQADDALDGIIGVTWIFDNYDITPLWGMHQVGPAIEQEPVTIMQGGKHARTLHHHRGHDISADRVVAHHRKRADEEADR